MPQRPSQLVEEPLFRRIRPSIGGGARGGGSPPRVGSNALNALLGKAFSERSEDFSAVERRESNGIFFRLSEKSLGLFRQPERAAALPQRPFFAGKSRAAGYWLEKPDFQPVSLYFSSRVWYDFLRTAA